MSYKSQIQRKLQEDQLQKKYQTMKDRQNMTIDELIKDRERVLHNNHAQ